MRELGEDYCRVPHGTLAQVRWPFQTAIRYSDGPLPSWPLTLAPETEPGKLEFSRCARCVNSSGDHGADRDMSLLLIKFRL